MLRSPSPSLVGSVLLVGFCAILRVRSIGLPPAELLRFLNGCHTFGYAFVESRGLRLNRTVEKPQRFLTYAAH
jgi:hypothetical protein